MESWKDEQGSLEKLLLDMVVFSCEEPEHECLSRRDALDTLVEQYLALTKLTPGDEQSFRDAWIDAYQATLTRAGSARGRELAEALYKAPALFMSNGRFPRLPHYLLTIVGHARGILDAEETINSCEIL